MRLTNKGFSLLEIMVAVSILAVSLLVILDLHGGSMRTSRRAEDITTASMLAKYQMQMVQLDIEKEMSKGEFPEEDKQMEGSFDEPFERYKWTANIKKVEIPVPPEPEGGNGENGNQGMGAMLQVFKMIAEKIKDAAREISLEVKWDDMGEEQKVTVSTHIVKL